MTRLAVVAGVLILVGCGAQPSPIGPARWVEPATYSYVLQAECGERSLLGRFRVRVEGGAIVQVERLDRAALTFPGRVEDIPTLGGLLAQAEEARGLGASTVKVTSDPIDGHPIRVEIDWQANAIDDGVCYSIFEYIAG